MGKPEILVGKSNGLRHSVQVWGASENMGGDLRRCNFFFFLVFNFQSLFIFFTWIYLVAGRSPTTSNRQILQSREPCDYRHVSSKISFPCALIGEKRPSLAFMIFIN